MPTLTTSITLPYSQDGPTSPPCVKCGTPVDAAIPDFGALKQAQERIEQLESQIQVLTLRATTAVERANEYETELRRLSSARSLPISSPRSENNQFSNISAATSPPSSPPRSAANRLVRLLSTRSARGPSPVSLSPTTASGQQPAVEAATAGAPDTALRDAISHEKELRLAAESQAALKDSEVEELTAQLFEQANEMVATERRARAKLESRVEVLEKRDCDKARRLGVLEMRVQRAERVRALLQEQGYVTKDPEETSDREGRGSNFES